MDIFAYIAGTLTTLCFVPQAWKIIVHKKTEGISLVTYTMFGCGVVLWLIYGITISNTPIIIFNVITLALTSVIVFNLVKLNKK